MKNNPEHILFGPSGCLSRDGLALFAKGNLSVQELEAVKSHLQSCEFCALAAEGMALANLEEFEQDLESIYASFENLDVAIPEEETIPEFTEGIEGPRFPRLSELEMQHFRDSMLQKTTLNQESEKPAVIKMSFFKRYRLEMIAAIILLLLAVGARQIYVGLSPKREQVGIAQAPVETEDTDQMDVIQQEITEREPFVREKAEIQPAPPKNTQKPEVLVDREVSDDFITEDDDSEVSLAQELAGKEAEATGESNAIETQDIPVVVQNQATIPYTPKVSQTEVTEAAADLEDRNRLNGKLANNATEESAKAEVLEEEVAEAEVFVIVEQAPEYPGGEFKKQKFFKENLNYPEAARRIGFKGTVYVTFVIEKDGNIADVRVLRGIGAGCDEEALRVMRLMPKWKPGTQRGKPVRVRINQPITFNFNEQK